jgi:cysteine-rich repeat protein
MRPTKSTTNTIDVGIFRDGGTLRSRLASLALCLLMLAAAVQSGTALAACGDGVVEPGEQCDDGNLLSGDGCTSECLVEDCVDDVTDRTNVCTANDVQIASLTPIEVYDECDFVGDTATVLFEAELVANSSERWDIGLFIAQDGGDGRTGACFRDFLPPPLETMGSCSVTDAPCSTVADCPAGETCEGSYDPLSGSGPFFNGEDLEDPADVCGDLAQGVETYYRLAVFDITCVDNDADGSVDIGTCISWDNARSDGSAQKPSCLSMDDTVPNTKSKCRCEDKNVAITIRGGIVVRKETDPSGDPTSFEFRLTDVPQSAVDQTFSLADGDSHSSGPLDPGTYSVAETVPEYWELQSASCDDGSDPSNIDLAPGETVTCTFRNHFLVNPPLLTVIKENDADGDGTFNSTETAPSAPVTVPYRITIENDSDWDATITSTSDDTHDISGSSCESLVGATVPAMGSVTCSFDAMFASDDQSVTNIFSASAENLAGSDSDSDDSTVIVADVLPDITVEKSASPTSVPESGDDVTFTVTVTNNAAEDVTLDSLSDDVFGDLNGKGSCSVPQSLAASGGSYTCSFTEFVSGDYGNDHVDTVTAVASDDDGNSDTETDSATVVFTDVPSSMTISKSPSRAFVPPTGGYVYFRVDIHNTSPVDDIVIDTISDSVFGVIASTTLPADISPTMTTCDDLAGTWLAPNATATCGFTAFVPMDGIGDTHHNVVTVDATDEDNFPLSDQDDATVTADEGPGTGTPGYWKNHPDAWLLVDGGIMIGDWDISGTCDGWEIDRHGGCLYWPQDEAIEILGTPPKGDVTYNMSRALIAAWLNYTGGNDFYCVEEDIDAGVAWLNENPVGSDVPGGGQDSPWREGKPIASRLDDYNNGLLCAPSRDSKLQVTSDTIKWLRPPKNADTLFDVVRGDLEQLVAGGGDFTSAVDSCIADDHPTTTVYDGQ